MPRVHITLPLEEIALLGAEGCDGLLPLARFLPQRPCRKSEVTKHFSGEAPLIDLR
jgi:hypothetical protein